MTEDEIEIIRLRLVRRALSASTKDAALLEDAINTISYLLENLGHYGAALVPKDKL